MECAEIHRHTEMSKDGKGLTSNKVMFPRGDSEGKSKAYSCEICTGGDAGVQLVQPQGPSQVCSDTTIEFQLFSPKGFLAK